jgi:hypothetical protein
MKQFFRFVLIIIGLYFTTGFTAGFAQESDMNSYSYWDFHPLHVGGNILRIGGANVHEQVKGANSAAIQRGRLFYRKTNAFLYMLVPLSMKSFFLPKVEWNTFTMDWGKNPKFNQTHFYYAGFSLTFYTTAVDRWRWILRAEYNLDTEHFGSPSLYGLFSGLVWGVHELNKQWNFHVGALGYSGMRGEQVYPIIGFDYSPDEHWTILATFPIEYYVQYKLDPHWKFSLRGRPLKERFRTGKSEPQPRSIFCYTSFGTELNVKYQIFLRLEIEAYGGYNLGGPFYIKNAVGKSGLYSELGAAPYGGLNLNWGI